MMTEAEIEGVRADVLGHHESQAEFDAALARAFSTIGIAKKDNKGNFGAYADLASVTEAIRGPLTDEGFSWPQTLAMEDGLVIVTTHLRRCGVELTSVLPMPVGKPGAHAIGSAITYARRYALAAMCGVCPDDDDGQAAQESGGGKARAPAKKKPQAKAEAKAMPAGWTVARELFGKVSKERGDVIQSNKVKGRASAADLFAKALGVKDAPPGREITAEQWTAATRVFRDDIDDIEMRLDVDADPDPHNDASERSDRDQNG